MDIQVPRNTGSDLFLAQHASAEYSARASITYEAGVDV